MKKKIFGILMLIALFTITGCSINAIDINGNKIELDKQYKDRYFTYKYSSTFKEITTDEAFPYPIEKRIDYEYYDNDNLLFILRVDENDAGISFKPLEEDKEKLEKDNENKNIKSEVFKSKGNNIVKYSYNRDDDFGNDTLYHIYYIGYSYMGVNEFMKVYFINATYTESLEKEFISSLKVNK